jgi:hypothetical protein
VMNPAASPQLPVPFNFTYGAAAQNNINNSVS